MMIEVVEKMNRQRDDIIPRQKSKRNDDGKTYGDRYTDEMLTDKFQQLQMKIGDLQKLIENQWNSGDIKK